MLHRVPTYTLYGEQAGEMPDFWGHAETIASRSRIHDWEIRPHRHEALFQILHIRSGNVEALLDGHWRDIPSPAAIIVPEGNDHGFRFSRDVDGAVMTVMSKRLPAGLPAHGVFADWLRQPRFVRLEREKPDSAYLGETLDRIEAELTHATGARAPLVETMLATALILLFRADGRGNDTADTDRDHARMDQLARLIDRHHGEHQPVEFYARRLGMSATHLNRVARAVTGRPVSRLLADRLISEARRDLVFTGNAVQQIAEKLGFDDAAYFSRFFTRNTGLSPRAYRERETLRMVDGMPS